MPKTAAKTKVKPIAYRFKPKSVMVQQAEEREQKRLRLLEAQRKVVKDVIAGYDYEDIARRRDISPEEAREISKQAIAKWGGDLGHTATEAREIDLRRLDALMVRLEPLIYPEPYIDNETGFEVIPAPDLEAAKLLLVIIDKRAKFLGTEAAHKLEETKTEILKRMYIGVAVNKQGAIDL